MGSPHNCLGDAFFAGGWNKDVMAAIVVQGWAKVPGTSGMGSKGSSEFGPFMDIDFDARGC